MTASGRSDVYDKGRIMQDVPPVRGTIIPSPAMVLDADGTWNIEGLCDVCREPYQGGSQKRHVSISTVNQTVKVCMDELMCKQAFSNRFSVYMVLYGSEYR
jgi:hypothetical protein